METPGNKKQSCGCSDPNVVFGDLKSIARKGHFRNGCTQRSFGTLIRETRKAILTDARNGLLGNGFAQGMGQIPYARNLYPRCAQPLT